MELSRVGPHSLIQIIIHNSCSLFARATVSYQKTVTDVDKLGDKGDESLLSRAHDLG